MTNYICLLLTSNGCGHCSAFRGDGIIQNGKNYMEKDYLLDIFNQADKNSKINLLNIHYENMSGQNKFISDISKFTRVGNNITQQRYFKYENKAKIRTILAQKKNKELGVRYVEDNGKQIEWSKLVEEKIPDQIKNYTYYFPCFLMIKTEEWKKAIEDKNYPLVAIPNAGLVVNDNGIVGLEKSPNGLQQRNVDTKRLISDITKGLVKIEPHKILNVKKNEEKEKVKGNSKKQVSNKFVIKSYDDY